MASHSPRRAGAVRSRTRDGKLMEHLTVERFRRKYAHALAGAFEGDDRLRWAVRRHGNRER